jgi:hypothetical protein
MKRPIEVDKALQNTPGIDALILQAYIEELEQKLNITPEKNIPFLLRKKNE